ncbi:MAG: nucleotidyl transferase [Desulfatiglans sp.]|nr:nucleotidyl transferase [Desulfatiglans sp.]
MFSVIMAGGSGTRFWPFSRKDRPKQLLDITGKGPMVVETCNRLLSISKDNEMMIILGESHREETQRLFTGRDINILAEPVGRNTAPCIGLGALYARYLGCRGPMAFLPADHFIGNPKAFTDAIKLAARACESGGIATLGIVPSRPETGYGYIQKSGKDGETGEAGIYNVKRFVEKPDLKKAMEYLNSGDYYWNAGIFVATPETILNEMKSCLPETYNSLLKLEPYFGSPEFDKKFLEVYSEIKSESFDYGVMEKTRADLYVVPCECGWSDVGSWESLYELRSDEYDKNKNLTVGDTLLIDCEGSFISSSGKRLVACLGVNNLIVVDRDDALLVADMKRSQDIKKIVDELKNRKREELL